MDDQKTSWCTLLQKDPELSKYRYQKNQVFITEHGFLSMVLGCRMKTADDIKNTTMTYLMKKVEIPSLKRTLEADKAAIFADMAEHHKEVQQAKRARVRVCSY